MTKHALVVDDNPNNVEILAEMLTMHGVENTVLGSAAKIDAFLATNPSLDLIFLDLEMPDETGYEVFERLKAHPVTQSTPIIAYTVHVSEINAIRDMGFHSFLGKPIDVDAFPKQLERLLNNEQVWYLP